MSHGGDSKIQFAVAVYVLYCLVRQVYRYIRMSYTTYQQTFRQWMQGKNPNPFHPPKIGWKGHALPGTGKVECERS